MSTEGLTTEKRVLVAGASISSFILGAILFQSIFNLFQIESITSAIMSVVSGTIIAWIVLILSGILKEFTIKGASFELSSKLKEVKDEVKTSNSEICNKISNLNQNFLNSVQNLNTRMDTIVTNISSSSAKSETNVYYAQSKEELNTKLQETVSASTAGDSKIISREDIEKIDLLMNKVNTLEKTLGRKVTLTPPEMLSRARYYFYKNQFENAIELYRDVLKEDKNNRDALDGLALCYDKSGNFDLSLDYFKQVNAINETADSLYNIGSIYTNLSDFENARKYLNKSLEKNPNHSYTILTLGDVAHEEGNISLAKEKYQQVLDVDPNNLSALEKISVLYQHNNDIVNAEKYATQLANITPKIPQEQLSKALGLIILGKLSEALEIINELLIKNPNNVAALYNKACVMSLRGDIDESIKLLQKVLKINKSYKSSLNRDPDLKNVRKSPKFQNVFES